ncbi:MAG: type II secretion system protein [Pseudomonadota bacterium]
MKRTALRDSHAQSGFTIVELIVVMVIAGTLAITGISRFSSASAANQRGFADFTLSAFHYAHRLATVGGCHTRVQSASNTLTISSWAVCTPASHTGTTTPVSHPDNSGTFVEVAPGGVTLGALDIFFDAHGQPHATGTGSALTSTTTLSVGSRSINIEAITGYAYE